MLESNSLSISKKNNEKIISSNVERKTPLCISSTVYTLIHMEKNWIVTFKSASWLFVIFSIDIADNSNSSKPRLTNINRRAKRKIDHHEL